MQDMLEISVTHMHNALREGVCFGVFCNYCIYYTVRHPFYLMFFEHVYVLILVFYIHALLMLLGGNDADVWKKEDWKHTWPWYPVSLVDGALAMAQSDVWSPTAVEKKRFTRSNKCKTAYFTYPFPVVILWRAVLNILYICQNHINQFHRFRRLVKCPTSMLEATHCKSHKTCYQSQFYPSLWNG